MNILTSSGAKDLASPLKIYWDSCAWLALINEEPGRKDDVSAVYTQARQGSVELWASTISIVEANRLSSEVNVARPLPLDSLAALDELFFQRFIKLVPIDIDIAMRARKLVRETPGLKKKADAIHLASAMRWNIPLFHTYDESDLLHLNGQIECDDGTMMEINVPLDPFAGGLFAKAPA